MRTRAARLVSLPLALVVIETGHAIGNALCGSPEGAAEIFEDVESGSELLPLALALALASLLAGVVARATAGRAERDERRTVALPFAVLPPIGFALLELLEPLVHSGSVPVETFAEPTFLVGLALQLPFALGGYLLARALLRLGDELGELVGRAARPVVAPPPPVRKTTPPPQRPRWSRRQGIRLGRAPPEQVVNAL